MTDRHARTMRAVSRVFTVLAVAAVLLDWGLVAVIWAAYGVLFLAFAHWLERTEQTDNHDGDTNG